MADAKVEPSSSPAQSQPASGTASPSSPSSPAQPGDRKSLEKEKAPSNGAPSSSSAKGNKSFYFTLNFTSHHFLINYPVFVFTKGLLERLPSMQDIQKVIKNPEEVTKKLNVFVDGVSKKIFPAAKVLRFP